MTSEATTGVTAAPDPTWHRVDEADVRTRAGSAPSVVDGRSVALTRCGGRARRAGEPLPAPGRPAGRGLDRERAGCAARGTATTTTRLTGQPAGGLLRRRPVRTRSRSEPTASTSRCPSPEPPTRTVADVLVETLVAWGVDTFFGMVGHSNLGFADALRRAEERGELTLHRHPARGRRGVRRQRLRQAHRPTRGLLRDRRTRLDQPAHRPVRRQARRSPGDRDLRAGAVEGAGPGRVPGPRPVGGLPRRRGVHGDRARRQRPRRAGRARRQARASTAAASPTSSCPTRCRTCPSRRAAPHRRTVAAPTGASPPPAALDAAAELLRARPASGDHRRARRAVAPRPSCGRSPSGSAHRCSPPSGPRAWCPTPTRSARACSAAAARPWRAG